jgi:hypothetical protein
MGNNIKTDTVETEWVWLSGTDSDSCPVPELGINRNCPGASLLVGILILIFFWDTSLCMSCIIYCVHVIILYLSCSRSEGLGLGKILFIKMEDINKIFIDPRSKIASVRTAMNLVAKFYALLICLRIKYYRPFVLGLLIYEQFCIFSLCFRPTRSLSHI